METLLSLITMYKYDPTIFDNFVIPSGLDIDLLTDNIMLDCAELELLYNNPDTMKFAIGRWSSKELKRWSDLYATTILEYNPLENYDRLEDFTETETRDLEKTNIETRALAGTQTQNREKEKTDTETRNLSTIETRSLETGVTGESDTTDNDVQGGANTSRKDIAAFNSPTLVTESLNTDTLGATNSKTVHTGTTQTGTDSGTVTSEDAGEVIRANIETDAVEVATSDSGTVSDAATDSGSVTNRKVGRAHGNIGVTTSQQMIEAERKVVELNMYDYITNSFKSRFCLIVY